MELGAVFPQTEIGDDPAAVRDFAQAVEGMGLTHLLIYDHVVGAAADRFERQVPYTKDSMFHEPFVTLGYLAACTTTIELVTGVIILPQRQTVLVAKQAAEVDVLSGGRLRLGVGTGWNHVEFEALNENFHNRGKRQEEQVALMRALWADEIIDFEGNWHSVRQAGINPRPKGTIPIWFGGRDDRLVTRAARIGDGWMPQVSPTKPPPPWRTSSTAARPPASRARASASRSRRAWEKATPTAGPRPPRPGAPRAPRTSPPPR